MMDKFLKMLFMKRNLRSLIVGIILQMQGIQSDYLLTPYRNTRYHLKETLAAGLK